MAKTSHNISEQKAEVIEQSMPLQSLFDDARDDEAYQKIQAAKQLDLDQARSVRMGTLDGAQVSTIRAGFAKAMNGGGAAADAQKANASADAMFYALLDQLRDLESGIAAQYGEDFALDLAEEMKKLDIIGQDDLDRINAMQSRDEQRDEVARLYQKAVDEGRATPEQIALLKEKAPWLKEAWLDMQSQVRGQEIALASGKLAMNDAFSEAVCGSSNKGDLDFDKGADNEIEGRETNVAEYNNNDILGMDFS